MRDRVIYQIIEEDLQIEAMARLGRELTDDELPIYADRLSDGIGENLGLIYQTIFDEAWWK